VSNRHGTNPAEAGKLDLENLLTRRIKFEELNDAVQALTSGDVIRQVVLFN
jgi:S-(hydroxymethyl)glutathione dehydrogenase/alcohol dehydrogenase